MTGAVLGYVLGYEDGSSSAQISRQRREIVDAVFYGQRLVQVDQSYLDQLLLLVEKFRGDSDHNFDKAGLFRREALEWKADAERHEAHAQALQAQVGMLQAQLAERDAALARSQAACAAERAVHQTTHEEKCSLDRFRLLATWLANAHIAGRSDRPEFAELLDMVKNAADAIQRGERFRGYLDTPENEARLDRVVAALDPP